MCEYRGDVLRTKYAIKLADKSYLMRLGPQVYIDARTRPDVLGRFINDCRDPTTYNVSFIKLPSEEMALVVALKDIVCGDELYVDYGRMYWLGLRPNRLTVK